MKVKDLLRKCSEGTAYRVIATKNTIENSNGYLITYEEEGKINKINKTSLVFSNHSIIKVKVGQINNNIGVIIYV